ncbi:hypothetical protein P154DRAFT_524945 [Amniculicola lignicola CBS 123094]|uniref:CHAT domain-containing protein n=1 Tax=Amniculicola lignicola CBS 123094 TaxID=1392246 RepID=A0A6A5W602_9PLEO|nr:hypothetical protein P154DRAFT_524945 [Amniculicola lignicola CBS 123094]
MENPGRLDYARAMQLYQCYHASWAIDDLNSAIEAGKLAVQITPLDHVDRAARCSDLATMFAERYQENEITEDITEAIKLASNSVEAAPLEYPYRPAFLNNLGLYFGMRYDQLEELEDLNQAIANTQQAIDSASNEDTNILKYWDSLATHLERRSTLGRNDERRQDAEQSVELGKLVLQSVSDDDDEDLPVFMANLGNHFHRLYDQDPKEEHLNNAINYTRLSVLAIDETHPMFLQSKNNLGIELERRYDLLGKREDLKEAIQFAREVVAATEESSPKLAPYLNTLAVKVAHVYDRVGHTEDLEEAVDLTRQALRIAPTDHLDRADWNNNLGNLLETLFRRTGKRPYIKESVQAGQQAVHLVSTASPDRTSYLINLSNNLQTHFEAMGDIRNLDDALHFAEQVVNLTPSTDSRRSAYLKGLGTKYNQRYEITGDMNDLGEAVRYARDALRSVPKDHRTYPTYLSNLASALLTQSQRTKDLEIVGEAIELSKEAISMTERSHQDFAAWQINFAHCLSNRYDYSGKSADLDEAIRIANDALEVSKRGHIDREAIMIDVAAFLSRRYNRDKVEKDLADSINLSREVLELVPEDHLYWSTCARTLGIKLLNRYEQKGDTSDRNSALQYLTNVIESLQTTPLDRITATRAAVRIHQDMKNWDRANELASEALKLLPLVCGRFLGLQDQQYVLAQISGLAADVCSLALKSNDVEGAILRLEFGRGLVLGYMLELRHDVSELRESNPGLADEYEILLRKASRKLESRDDSVRQMLLRERREAAKEFESCVQKIRCETFHKRFLLGPTIQEMKGASIHGPIVVVNITDISADALIIIPEGIKRVKLPGLLGRTAPSAFKQETKTYTVVSRGDYHRDMQNDKEASLGAKSAHLAWLWTNCVKLILEALGYINTPAENDLPRVWWIGTGIASMFPFHAAGIAFSGLTDNTLSYIIPSYAHSIKALLYMRSKIPRSVKHDKQICLVLVVTMPKTPGQTDLPGATVEASAIRKACNGVYDVEVLPHPSAVNVSSKLSGAAIVHFACHAYSDPADPSKSHLILRKAGTQGFEADRLTLGDMADIVLQGQARMAFLSACSTAQVKAHRLADEGLHLANTFQVAGFQHVIGALWAADDEGSARTAELFYTYLVKDEGDVHSDGAVASVLRRTVLQIRSEYPKSPEIWAPFIHFGT